MLYRAPIAPRRMSVESRPPSSFAPVLGLRQDSSVGVDTSGGLLLTVLGEFVLPNDGVMWTQTLVGLMGGVGVRDKAARQALARMHDRGWLARDKVGRQTRWRLTPTSRRLLEQGAERIYGFGQTARPWDGSWVVLLASVPERDRQSRYRMGVGLGWSGFGSIGQGVWLSPWVQQERVAVDLLRQLGVDGTSFRAELGAIGSAPGLAAGAWDLPELRAQYEEFLADTESLRPEAVLGGDAAALLTTLVHRWRRFPFRDPDLPAALLPVDWPGPPAARRFADLRRALSGEAQRWWLASEASFAPAGRSG
jgi:phenylacetic acid degradation operon negative regulatory protein